MIMLGRTPVTKNVLAAASLAYLKQVDVCHKCLKLVRCSLPYSTSATQSQVHKTVKYPSSSRHHASTVPVQWEKPDGHDTGIRVWNSLTKRKDPLILMKKNQATWYNCGPTVYDSAHIGHASTGVRFDIIRRILTNFFNINVIFVQSVTDIDDKIIKRCNEMGIPMAELTRRYETEFNGDMAALNVLPPTVPAHVTDHITQIISFVQALIDSGLAYPTVTGSVYFAVEKYGRYGIFAPPSVSAEPGEGDGKRSSVDFALWKGAKPGEPAWSCPWGQGRPGWHIECSAMGSALLGERLDMHSGGEDLKFPHHENELAQSQAFHDCDQWVNYWLHTGHLHLKGQDKMSKSLKNFITISDMLKDYTADEFRTFCLLTHYNQRAEYSAETMQKAVAISTQIKNCLQQCQAYIKGQIHCHPIPETEFHEGLAQTRDAVHAALCDDFNTPKVLDLLMRLVKHLNLSLSRECLPQQQSRSPATVAAVSLYLQQTLQHLGFGVREGQTSQSMEEAQDLNHILDSVVKFRTQVRNFALNPPEELLKPAGKEGKQGSKAQRLVVAPLLEVCDSVRTDLLAANVQVKDHKNESSWMRVQSKQKQDKS